MNDEFMGMADYVIESIHKLLTSDLETISDSASSQGSYHPSCECFMAKIADDPRREVTPKGCGASADDDTSHGGNRTHPHLADGHEAATDTEVPCHPPMHQLRERQQELDTM
jgi:hypothetical protein